MRVFPHRYGESILLAVSGGVDSIVMAHLFLKKPVRLCIAHCNFHLRGDESDGDAAFVRSWAEDNGVECLVRDFDTEQYASSNNISIEMAARELRYAWFDQLCRERGFDGTCVAHNANDNVETLFLNLLRGTGVSGLCAMSEISSNPCGSSKVFRPLLEYSRKDILDYASRNGLTFRTDSSNLSSEYKRNILRNDVFPLLGRINPSFIATVGRDISLLRQARDILDDYISEKCPDKLAVRSEDGMTIDLGILATLTHKEYILFRLLEEYGFNSSVVRNISELLSSDRIISGRTFYGQDYVAISTTGSLIVTRRNSRGLPGAASAASSGEGTAVCPEVDTVKGPKVELLEWNADMEVKTPRGITLLDADSLTSGLLIRKWEDGDYLHPTGLRGKKKVSDLLTDLKYNILQKQEVMVVELDGHHVAAVIGERVDEAAKITSSTRRVYRISL